MRHDEWAKPDDSSGPCPCCGHVNADPSDPDCDQCLWKRVWEAEVDPEVGNPNNNDVPLTVARELVRRFGPVAGRLTLRSGGLKTEELEGLTQTQVELLATELGLDADYA